MTEPLRKRQDRHLRGKYGITLEHYEALHAIQEGLCAICDLPEKANDPRKVDTKYALAVDHTYGTGTIRGLLCSTCNRALGYMKDSPALLRRAADYLDQHNGEG